MRRSVSRTKTPLQPSGVAMKLLVVLSALVAACAGQVLLFQSPLVHSYVPHTSLYPYISPVASQFRAQDELGQFTFATAGDNQGRVETKTLDGAVRGEYSYVDPNGKLNYVRYQADADGFRVLANNLPVAPGVPEVPVLAGPEPVKDTPEVVAARADFLKKFDEAAKAASAPVSRRRRQAILLPAPLAKTTFKYSEFEPVDAAVPASTRKVDLKEKEQEILTPLSYHAPLTYSAPLAYRAPLAYSAPLPLHVAAIPKTTLKLQTLEAVDAAVPAATKKLELREREQEIISPVQLPLISTYSGLLPTQRFVVL